MNIQPGMRKLAALIVLLLVFILLTIIILITSILSNNKFNAAEFAQIFVPLGAGLASLAMLFFTANAAEHFSGKK